MKSIARIFGASYCVSLLKSILTFSVALASTSSMGHLRTQQEDGEILSGGKDNQQLTACRISSKELLSVAESTARGILQGICNPRKPFLLLYLYR